MNELRGKLSREIEITFLKKKGILELKNTQSEVKNSLNGI